MVYYQGYRFINAVSLTIVYRLLQKYFHIFGGGFDEGLLFDMNLKEAAEKPAQDFGIPYDERNHSGRSNARALPVLHTVSMTELYWKVFLHVAASPFGFQALPKALLLQCFFGSAVQTQRQNDGDRERRDFRNGKRGPDEGFRAV